MAFTQNNPLSRKTSPINRDWIKGAIKRPGAFRKKAEEAGMSTKAFADKVIANKEDYSARTGKQAELAETLMGMSRHKSGHKNPEQGDFDYEDPNYRDTPEYKKFKRKQKRQERKNNKNKPKRGEAGFEQDEQEAYYESKSDKMDKNKGVSRNSSISKEAPLSRDGEKAESLIPVSSVISKGTELVKKGAKKFLDTHLLNPKNINKGRKAINTGIKKIGKKVENLTEGVKAGYTDFVKDTQKLSGTGGPSRKNCKYKK